LTREIRHAVRRLLRTPGFTLAGVLTLALGIGANTAIYSVARGVFLRPLPYLHGDHLVHTGYRVTAEGPLETRFSVRDFFDYREGGRAFIDLVEYHSMSFNLLGRGEPERVKTAVVSARFFDVFGVRPALGRAFRPDDEKPGAPPVLLLSEGFWQRHFGGDPAIIGQTLRMNGGPITVVGVLPRLPRYPGGDDVYMPTASCPFRSAAKVVENRSARMLSLFGRLHEGVSLAQAQAQLATIAIRLTRDYPDSHPGVPAQEAGLIALREELSEGFRSTFLLLLGAVALTLLLACISVINLFLVRVAGRSQEVALRISLGASRSRLLWELLAESVLLALMGGALGLLLSVPSLGILKTFASRSTPRADEIGLDGSALLFTLLLSLATGLAVGLFPALRLSRRDPGRDLRQAGAGAIAGRVESGWRKALVVAQVAISSLLLIGAGLLVRSLSSLERVQAGFDPDRVLTASLELPRSKYPNPQARQGFYRSLLERLGQRPGVTAAAVASDVPLDGDTALHRFTIEGRPTVPGRTEPQAEYHVASQDYFRALGIPLLAGRGFAASDAQSAPGVVLINRTMADQLWPGESPIGRRLGQLVPGKQGAWTIVGVVGDVKQVGLDTEAGPSYYLPFLQEPGPRMRVMLRTAAAPLGLAEELRSAVRELDPEQPIAEVEPLTQLRQDSISAPRLRVFLLSAFALLAFLIASIGVGSVVAYSVSQRSREIGIRMALGARKESVLAIVLGQGLALVLSGLFVGLLGALLLTRLLSSLLFGIRPSDPATYLAVALALLIASALACLGPARRALHVEPTVALRS
jgi:putative ABC transport system permease protein